MIAARRNTRRILSAFVLVLLCFFNVFLSCSPSNRLPGYVCYRLNANPTTLDPAFIVDVTGGSLSAKLFNGLVRLGPDLQIVSDLAERWTVSADGLTYRFTLRRGARFSNGREATARDFIYSFERILDPKTVSRNTWVLEKIRGAKDFAGGRASRVAGLSAPDDYTIVITLEKPFAPFLSLLTMTAAYVVPREEVERLGPDFSKQPIGTGPFLLRKWEQNRTVILDARRDYFGGAPKVRGIVYRVIFEDLTAIADFDLGNLDLLSLPAAGLQRYRDDRTRKDLILPSQSINTYYLGFNCSRPPFDSIDLRRAVSMAIDRKKLLATHFENRGRLAAGPVAEVLRAWQSPSPWPYDPEESRRIVKAAYAGGRPIRFYVSADQEVVDMAEFIQAYLVKVGLAVEIRQLEWSAYKAAINRGEADMFWIGWWADYADPENFLFPLFHSSNHGPAGNRARYTNHEVDRLIEAGQAAARPDQSARFYSRAEEVIVSEAPWVFFWHKNDFVIRQPWVKGYRPYPIYSMDKGMEIEIEQESLK